MAVCANCEHPVPFHGGPGCSARYEENDPPCGCKWHEEGALPAHVAAVARPGDIVIIGFNRALSDEEVGWLTESFQPVADLGVKVGFADNVSSIVVVKGSSDANDGE